MQDAYLMQKGVFRMETYQIGGKTYEVTVFYEGEETVEELIRRMKQKEVL